MIGRTDAFDLPLLLTKEGGEGRGEEMFLFGPPLSPALSPLVPRGERVSGRVGSDTPPLANILPIIKRSWYKSARPGANRVAIARARESLSLLRDFRFGPVCLRAIPSAARASGAKYTFVNSGDFDINGFWLVRFLQPAAASEFLAVADDQKFCSRIGA